MKKNQIEIGGQYTCKVSDKIVVVRITGENPHGGWDAINLETNKKVRIKSAQRLRSARFVDQKTLLADPALQKVAKDMSKTLRTQVGVIPSSAKKTEAAPAATRGDAKGESKSVSKVAARRDTGEPGATTEKRLGILGAAVRVLEEHKGTDPLNCLQMVEQMTAKGYWAPRRGGKTPANTLYAAILCEIRDKKEASRFKKVDRGRFILNR